jgi:uncharacterized protein (DUF924 family)
MASPDDLLHFWFGDAPAATAEQVGAKMRRWYMGGPEMDRDVRERFATDVERAVAGELAEWADAPRSRLALILLLDQFTRNMFRDTPRAWATDPLAQRLAVEAFDRGLVDGLNHEERHFFIMPLLHAEDLALQDRAIALMDEHVAKVPAAVRQVFAAGQEQTHKYRAIIARFGRFPHRNRALGRESTVEEREFLERELANLPPAVAREWMKSSSG